jgi:peptidyl-prolyl cis-trans isomerase C
LQVKTEEEADALLAVLENGADFGELAMVESDCPSRKQGGDLGWFG